MDGCIRSSFCFVTVSPWGEWAGEVKLRVETRQYERSAGAGCAEDSGGEGPLVISPTPSPFTAPSTNSWSISILGSMRLINAASDRWMNIIWWQELLGEGVRKCQKRSLWTQLDEKKVYIMCTGSCLSRLMKKIRGGLELAVHGYRLLWNWRKNSLWR